MIWAAAALAALFELDGDSVGQFGLARPIVVGPVLGCLLGAPGVGLMFGIVLEMLALGEAPIGGCVPVNSTLATATAVIFATSTPSGLRHGYEVLMAVPVGLGVGWLRAALERPLRALRGILVEKASSLGRAVSGALAIQLALNVAMLFVVVAIRPAHFEFPMNVDVVWGLERLNWVAPWLGAATLLHALRARA